MGRKLRTSLPVHPKVLEPQLPDKTTVRNSEENQRKSQEAAYNQRHRSRLLRPLQEGDKVWTTDCKSYGLVVRQTGHPRSYLVQTSRGRLRHNRRHLVLLQGTIPDTSTVLPELPEESVEKRARHPPNHTTVTRSGRASKPPIRWTPTWTK